ncbi:hypothetical protein [Micavibrio aeruginosavorus]|uniref:hypothetical protein n=1 Tax=Micavibrio aeruginosavorus TaxID=349221 RepID=UPI003F4ABF49
MRAFIPIIVTALALSLAGCSSSPEMAALPDGPLTPMPDFSAPKDPSDKALEQSIASMIKSGRGPAFSQYDFLRVDLDHDGRRDALVMMKGPHNYWCSISGCSMIVMKADNESFTPVSNIMPIRGPVLVAETQNNGWRDIVIEVRGQSWEPARQVALKFDGSAYPGNPLNEPPATIAYTRHDGVRAFP